MQQNLGLELTVKMSKFFSFFFYLIFFFYLRSLVPVLCINNPKFIKIYAGFHHSMALTSDGKLYGWGNNEFGQLGIGSKVDQSVPIIVQDNQQLKSVVCGGNKIK